MARLIDRFPLSRGSHPSPREGMCAMELVAWLAGEPHGDEPRCACPVLAALVRACNDLMGDAARERYLRPLAPRLVNSIGDAGVATRRAFSAADHALRVLAPMTLERQGLYAEAEQLRNEPVVDGPGTASAALAIVRGVAPELRAVAWTLRRARQDAPPTSWVSGVAHAARAVGDDSGWREVMRLIRELVRSDAGASEVPRS